MSVVDYITNPLSIGDLRRSDSCIGVFRGWSRAWHLPIVNYVPKYLVMADTLILIILIYLASQIVNCC